MRARVLLFLQTAEGSSWRQAEVNQWSTVSGSCQPCTAPGSAGDKIDQTPPVGLLLGRGSLPRGGWEYPSLVWCSNRAAARKSVAGCGGGGLAPDSVLCPALCACSTQAIFVGHRHRRRHARYRAHHGHLLARPPASSNVSGCSAAATAPSFGAGRPSARILVFVSFVGAMGWRLGHEL